MRSAAIPPRDERMTTTFRTSEFIDFETGVVKLPPMVLVRHLKRPWTLADKITLFHCRVDVWHLGVAVQMLKEIESRTPESTWAHAAYGMISVAFTYFEMIGKTLNPQSKGSGTANRDFNWGFCDVYPEYGSSGSYDDVSVPIAKEFRNRVRNGMYHLAFTKSNLWIHNNPRVSTKDFDVIQRSVGGQTIDYYCVNPHSMVRRIVAHFPTFIARLRDPDAQYDVMRREFEEFLEDFHKA